MGKLTTKSCKLPLVGFLCSFSLRTSALPFIPQCACEDERNAQNPTNRRPCGASWAFRSGPIGRSRTFATRNPNAISATSVRLSAWIKCGVKFATEHNIPVSPPSLQQAIPIFDCVIFIDLSLQTSKWIACESLAWAFDWARALEQLNRFRLGAEVAWVALPRICWDDEKCTFQMSKTSFSSDFAGSFMTRSLQSWPPNEPFATCSEGACTCPNAKWTTNYTSVSKYPSMTMGVNSSPTGDTPALSAATVDMVGQSRPAVQAWQSAAVRSGEFKSETSMLPALQPHPADGGEIFIGGTLWKQSTTCHVVPNFETANLSWNWLHSQNHGRCSWRALLALKSSFLVLVLAWQNMTPSAPSVKKPLHSLRLWLNQILANSQ